MKKIHQINIKTTLVILFVAALFLAVYPNHAFSGKPVSEDAATICSGNIPPGDYDGDGITNEEECNGLLLNGTIIVGYSFHTNEDRSTYLDPAHKDIIGVLVRDSENPSNIPTDFDPLLYLNKIDITYHLIDEKNTLAGGKISSNQYPIFWREYAGAYSIMGRTECQHCTLNDEFPNNVWVFTKAIKDQLDKLCATKTCISSSGATGLDLLREFIAHTLAHENGHNTMLTSQQDQDIGWHYDASKGIILSQYVTFREGKDTIEWNIGTEWGRTDTDLVQFVKPQ